MRRRDRDRIFFENMQQESGVNNEEYYMAYKRMKRIKGFYTHLIVYVLVNIYLIVNRRFESDTNEVFFQMHTYSTAFFWGLGLVAHGLSVFGRELFFGENWEEKKIKQFMEKDKNNRYE
jgi:hypothetical protein